MQKFVTWYNTKHKHRGIKFVTSNEHHLGLDEEILEKRKKVLLVERAKNPHRWSGDIQNCVAVSIVTLNPEKEDKLIEEDAA